MTPPSRSPDAPWLRRLGAADATDYRRLMLQAYAQAADAFTSTPEERAAEPLSWWQTRIADAGGLSLAFGAFEAGRLIGTVALEFNAKPKTLHKALLIGMFVDAAWRGCGIGRSLVVAAIGAARERAGIRLLTLNVTEGNREAIALYESCGFQAFGIEPMAIVTPAGDRAKVCMALELARVSCTEPGATTLDAARPSAGRPLHIGIVACSAEGAALCYRTICAEGTLQLGPHAHPPVSLHGASLAAYVERLERGDIDGVAALMLDSAHRLARAGADFLICPDNTLHQAFGRVAPRSPLPWLHIAEVVAAEAAARGFTRVGLLGTAWLLRSSVYPDKLSEQGIECIRPDDDECAAISRIIMDELVCGIFNPGSLAFCLDLIARLKSRGCQAVILGCTELPLIIDDNRSLLPTLDSTRLLARAALRHAIGGP